MLPWTAFYYRGTLATGSIIVLPVLEATFSLPTPSLVSGTSLALPAFSVVSQPDASYPVDGTDLLLSYFTESITFNDVIVIVDEIVFPVLRASLGLLPFTILDGSVIPIETLSIHCDTTTTVYDVSVCNLLALTCSVGVLLEVLDGTTLGMPVYSVQESLQSVSEVDGTSVQVTTQNVTASTQAIVVADGTSVLLETLAVNVSQPALSLLDATIVTIPTLDVDLAIHAFWVILEHEPIWFNTVLCSGVAFVRQFDSGFAANTELDTAFTATYDLEGEEYKP